MANLKGIVKQLKKGRDQVQKQLSGIEAAIAAFAKVYTAGAKPIGKRGKLSLQGRGRIAAAQRARWAKLRAKKKAA